jgi:hypothetical protein
MKLSNVLAISALVTMSPMAATHAALIDVAFYSSAFPNAQPSGAAVLGSAGDQWNWVDGAGCPSCSGPVSLTDMTGNPTTATLSYQADGAVISATTGTQPVPNLTNTYLFNNSGGSITVTLNGLAASQAYNLVLYVSSDDASGDRALTGTVTGLAAVPFSATGDPQPAFVNGKNVVQLAVTSDASGTLLISEDNPGNGSGEVDLNGLQLQAVPLPSSLVLFSGGVALLARRARSRPRPAGVAA